jgi:hypothetical protein
MIYCLQRRRCANKERKTFCFTRFAFQAHVISALDKLDAEFLKRVHVVSFRIKTLHQ